MTAVHTYACARVGSAPEPKTLGFTGYTQSACERCQCAIWVGPLTAKFRAAHPAGRVMCNDCSLEELKGAKNIIYGKASDML